MKIADFFSHLEAEIVGGRVKALIDGVHHFIADIVNGNPVLTAAGQAAYEELKAKAPHTAAVAENAMGAIQEITQLDPALVAAELAGTAAPEASLSGLAAAVAKPVAEKAAVDAVDSILDGITATVAKKGKAAAKAIATADAPKAE